MNESNPWNDDKPYDLSASWVSSLPYQRIINKRMTSDEDVSWFQHTLERYIMPRATPETSCLLLGSNEGRMELALVERGFTGPIVASDIADKALQRASEAVRARGITNVLHVRADLNQHSFSGRYDFIIAEGVLHHIENINFCINNLRTWLKPGGLLFAMEYVGAFRFQLPAIQREWINAALAAVPRRYRPFDHDTRGDFPASLEERARVYYVTPSIESMIAYDPSEAVAGHLLAAELHRNFTLLEENHGGGQIMMYITGHFPFEETNTNPDCVAWLHVMAHMEDVLMEQSIVPSDLVFYVAQAKC